MKSHSSTYEQYCYVRGGNVVFLETVRHDGARFVRGAAFPACQNSGGCKNTVLQARIAENAVDERPRF